jgi:hypothetical protein
MVDTLKLFISASNDLFDERELVGHILTEIPVTIGWQINLTPTGMNTGNTQLILDADFHLVIFGEDIRAPVGYEWHISRSMGRVPPFLIKKDIPRTIAGGDFLKKIAGYPHLLEYNTLAEFRKHLLTQIGQHILDQSDYFNLQTLEFENISKFLEDIEDVEPNLLDNVTGKDSIILTRERFIPKNGVLIQSPDDDQLTENSRL